uniref:Mannosyl-glycoprotein endo-beta-N-acetylglucosaminidase n=1 Tax=Macrostomum lignano TaxID=282301 RepID=A0A1I8ITY4_9PLAT
QPSVYTHDPPRANQIPERAGCMAAGSDRPSAFGAAPREDLPTSSPRVLVCHDMQGGYLDDAYLYGNANASAFRLFHWHLIDSGLEAMRQLLSNEKDAIGWADRLIDLADAGGFDGWLINVEVALPAELVPALQAFVRRLKSKSSLHIVWYDSVITDGQLLWQNSVNALNEDFLIAAGSILLNYCWTADLLKSTAGRLAELQSSSSSTLTVYVGVDCFGRGCPGGGGFNCSEAVRMIVENQQLGVGLFAPGWAYETCRSAAEPDEADGDAANLWRVGSRPPGVHKRLETACGRRTRCRTIGCAVLSSTLSLWSSRAWQGGGCLRVALSGGVGGGIGGNGGCELPLFRLSLPARQVPRSEAGAQRQQQQQLIVLCHSSESRLSCSEMATVQSHYSVGSGGGSSQTLVFPELCAGKLKATSTARPAARAGNGGVVWHTVYTEAADPALVDGNNKDASYADKDCVLEQLCLFFILPSRLESTEPVCVYLGQVKVALVRERPLAATCD